jgi:hypothetical protein
LPDLYVPVLRALADYPAAALGCSELAIVGSDGSARGIRPLIPPSSRAEYLDPQTICRRIKRTDHWICSTTTVFRVDLLRNAGGFDPSLGVFHDIIVERLLAFEHGFVYLPGVRAIFRVDSSTSSISALLDQNENTRQLGVARERLATSTVGRLAPDYPDLFARRLRFSAARLQLTWNGRNADAGTIAKVAGGTGVDTKVLALIQQTMGFGMIGRVFALGWLTFRCRPFSLPCLLLHMLRNRLALMSNRRRVTDWLQRMDDAGRKIMAPRSAKGMP